MATYCYPHGYVDAGCSQCSLENFPQIMPNNKLVTYDWAKRLIADERAAYEEDACRRGSYAPALFVSSIQPESPEIRRWIARVARSVLNTLAKL